MDKNSVLEIFNNQFKELIENISKTFPKNTTISQIKLGFGLITLIKPILVYKGFKQLVIDAYRNEVNSGDITFFIDKDYKQDLSGAVTSMSEDVSFLKRVCKPDMNVDSELNSILEKIDTLREPVREMNKQEQQNVMKYIQNLMKLSDLYETR